MSRQNKAEGGLPSAFTVYSWKLSSPISQVQEVVSNGAVTKFGNRRQHPLELVASDPPNHYIHKFFIETSLYTFLRTVALVNQQVQKFVSLLIRKTQFTFICLVFPQIGGWRLVNDRGWDIHRT
jgi:hypothetical protein